MKELNKFIAEFNNTVPNIGNANSLVNYGAWGAVAAVSPFSYFKTTQGEGGVRPPVVMKLPGSSNQTKPDIVSAFVQVNDMTPTFLDYAGVTTSWFNIQRSCSSCNNGKILETVTGW